MLTWAIALRVLGIALLTHGDSRVALVLLHHARDMALRDVGAKDARLAVYDDALAAGLRARGKLRDAMRYHREALGVGETAASLVERARTEVEGGELQHAFADLERAHALGANVDVDAADAAAFARWIPKWVNVPPHAVTATEGDTPAAIATHAEKMLATGNRVGATGLLRAAVPDLGEEPTRSALRIYVALARASGDAQAARAAIAAFQAMPEAERSAYDEMWDLSRR
ncbi:MAG: hypothetical protein JO257_24920 [Deltaproteobacteria bacterium]|nr:hypothetical protein [Deltaproteobacteria bacterium]